MRGFAYTLDLMLSTSILIILASIYFSITLDEMKYPLYERNAYYLDSYMLGLITAAEKAAILNESISNQTRLSNILNYTYKTFMGTNICIYLEIYNSSSFYSSGPPLRSIYKPGCSVVAENARIYYRHVYREYNPHSGYYVFKFFAWYK